MNLKKHTFVLMLLLLILTGCNSSVYYISITDLSKVRSKTEMQSFEQLNDPIVITMPIYEKMALFGNVNMGSYNKRAGDIFVVYDWENTKIHDWCFFEGNHGWSNFRAVEMGNPVKYYDSGERIGCLNKNGKLTVYQNDIKGTFTNLNNNQKIKSLYGLINTDGYSNGKHEYRINLFNSETGKVDNNQLIIYSQDSYFSYPKSDLSGNYWLTAVNEDKNCLYKVDVVNNKIDVVAKFLDRDYKGMKNITPVLREIYKNYAILSDGEYDKYPNIIVYDIEKNIKYCEISLPKENYPNRMFACAPVNSKLYGIFPADHDRDNWCEWTDIYEIDIENRKVNFCTTLEFDMTETVYTRGSRIYLLNSRDLSVFKCNYYDTETGQKGIEFSISLDEVISK